MCKNGDFSSVGSHPTFCESRVHSQHHSKVGAPGHGLRNAPHTITINNISGTTPTQKIQSTVFLVHHHTQSQISNTTFNKQAAPTIFLVQHQHTAHQQL